MKIMSFSNTVYGRIFSKKGSQNKMKKVILLSVIMIFITGKAFAACDYPMNINAVVDSISCSSSSTNVAYSNTGPCIAIENTGSVGVFVKSGNSIITAATTNNYLAPGKGYVFTKTGTDTHLACITAGSSSTLYLQSGSGD